MANVELTDEETALISNAGFLLTKNTVIQKLQQAFGSIAATYRNITQNGNPAWQSYCAVQPKISKGEQFQGLPYLMLDYPRAFSRTDTLAVRSFFWWGNYFSISLLLTGKPQQSLSGRLLENPVLGDWYLDTAPTPWSHGWEMDPGRQLSAISGGNGFTQKDFFKISKQVPLSQWQGMEPFFIKNFEQLWTAINCPGV